MTCMLRFHSEISKCVMENLCALLMKTHKMGDLFPPASFGGDALCVTSMKTRDVGELFPLASFGGDAICVACMKTHNVEYLFPAGISLKRCCQCFHAYMITLDVQDLFPPVSLDGDVWCFICYNTRCTCLYSIISFSWAQRKPASEGCTTNGGLASGAAGSAGQWGSRVGW